MTNFERFRAMGLNELVDWLDEYGAFDDSPWTQWFDCKYCKNCPDVMCHYEGREREFPCSWCEIHGKCQFFQELNDTPDNKEIIRMWLQEGKNNDKLRTN